MARRSGPVRELVRLTPFQFSLSVAVVVLLLAGAYLAGYLKGLRTGRRDDLYIAEQVPAQEPRAAGQGAPEAGTPGQATPEVTFYTALKEDRGGERAVAQPPPPEPAPAEPPGASPGAFMIQVASYKSRESAGRFLAQLVGSGYAGTIVRADLGERGIWHRVRVGPYADREDAGGALRSLEAEFSVKGFVVKE